MTKQVIVIRKDLKMRRGKEIAQGGHASISFISHKFRSSINKILSYFGLYLIRLNSQERIWFEGNFRKITLQVDSEQELMDIFNNARKANLEVNLITDSGLTEFNGIPTHTCLAIGPDTDERIDAITGHLKIY